MADPLALDPGSYSGTYKLVGGSLALDLANLVSYRGSQREHDWLDPPSNLIRWTRAIGVHASEAVDVAGVRRAREMIARVFLAVADGQTPAPYDIEVLGTLAAQACSQRRLRFRAGASAAVWEDTAATLAMLSALDAVRLLTSEEEFARVAACDGCRWVFLDSTRNRSRRWCDPADCGNRARQRRHYQRHHAR